MSSVVDTIGRVNTRKYYNRGLIMLENSLAPSLKVGKPWIKLSRTTLNRGAGECSNSNDQGCSYNKVLNYPRINKTRYDIIRYDTIRYDMIRYDTIRYDMV